MFTNFLVSKGLLIPDFVYLFILFVYASEKNPDNMHT